MYAHTSLYDDKQNLQLLQLMYFSPLETLKALFYTNRY